MFSRAIFHGRNESPYHDSDLVAIFEVCGGQRPGGKKHVLGYRICLILSKNILKREASVQTFSYLEITGAIADSPGSLACHGQLNISYEFKPGFMPAHSHLNSPSA